MQVRRKQGKCVQQHIHALFFDQPPDGQDDDGIGWIAAIANRAPVERPREAREVESMVDKFDLAIGRQGREVIAVCRRTGHEPLAFAQFFTLFPFGSGPDILRVGRSAPWQPAQKRSVASDRRRRMKEVRMQPTDVLRQFIGEHQRLTKAADPIRCTVT